MFSQEKKRFGCSKGVFLLSFFGLELLLLLIPWLSSQPVASPRNMVQFEGIDFLVYKTSSNEKIQFFWRDGNGSLYNTLSAVKEAVQSEDKTLLFATNGGMYHFNRHPVGLYIEDGAVISPLNLEDNWGNFFLKPNGIFATTKSGPVVVDSTEFSTLKNVINATQSGPLLLKMGKIHPAFKINSTSVFIRSGVGVTPEGRTVFAISLKPVNFYQFARLFRDKLGVDNALYLDGDISQVYLPESPAMGKENMFGPIIGVVATK
ncbi:MAG: phosphodiester glycosidase family protein [Magnetococcales bacterium]|nr:phosphodiester glycosidase family protein [Magnetococcales bacterium]